MMFVPSHSARKKAKDAPNNVQMNMINLAQTSLELLKGGDVSIFLVVISNPDSLHFNCDCTSITLSTF